MQVRDIVYHANGMTVAFDDNSVANILYKIVGGQLTLIGLTAAQSAALEAFNRAQTSTTTQTDLRLPPATIQENVWFTGGTSANGTNLERMWNGSTDLTRHMCGRSGNLRLANYQLMPSAGFGGTVAITLKIRVDGVVVWTLPLTGNNSTALRNHVKFWEPGEVPVQAGSEVYATLDIANNPGTTWSALQLTFVYNS